MPRDMSEARRMAVAAIIGLAGLLAVVLGLSQNAHARDPDGRYINAPHSAWFKSQHNSKGEWCCDESDGRPFFGNYTLNEDGSVTIEPGPKQHVIAAELVLKGPNPTGHAVWWYRDGVSGHRDYCFAPGTLS